jgi:Ca2+-binding RTX toxin-like protein
MNMAIQFGGNGKDMLTGGSEADQLFGDNGNDTLIGGRGDDTLVGGNGNDTFTWNPGDGSDVVEGQHGFDTLLFNGAIANETVVISADGERALFNREPAGITMDLNGVENITFNALGGEDNITIKDLTGTDVKQVNIDLAGTSGGGDGQMDKINILTDHPDAIKVINHHNVVTVLGLSEKLTISNFESDRDQLLINDEPFTVPDGHSATVAAVNGNNTGGKAEHAAEQAQDHIPDTLPPLRPPGEEHAADQAHVHIPDTLPPEDAGHMSDVLGVSHLPDWHILV